MGTRTEEDPDAKPIMKRDMIMLSISRAKAWRRPPRRKVQTTIMRAPRRPRVSAKVPANTAPNGPPTAKAATAIDQEPVEWPGKTTASGAFITPVLYPTKNWDVEAAITEKINGMVTRFLSASSSSSINRLAFDRCNSISFPDRCL